MTTLETGQSDQRLKAHRTPLSAPVNVDPSRWPDIARVPHKPLRAAVARQLLYGAVRRLQLRVSFPNGDQWGAGGADTPVLRLIRPDHFVQRVGANGLIGFGESYMAGDWEADDVTAVLTVMASQLSTLIPPRLQRLRQAAVLRTPSWQDNTLDGARDNIQHHYDLSNDLFRRFLDQSLSYSSALFDGDPANTTESLESAQHRKVDRMLDEAGVTHGTRLLEIGTGWGELAIRAASRGAHVTTVTLSDEQAALANERVAAAGLSDLVDIQLRDYREVTGRFDAIVSVEMYEAVGAPHWPEYFGALDALLEPGGRVCLQAITMPHDRMLASMNTYTWILKYIFPGGQIASVQAIQEQLSRTSLRVASNYAFGQHYAETLRRWRATFEANAVEVDALGFDQVFRRMWSLYLAYSEAGFRSAYLDVNQFTLVKAPKDGS
ncbi:MAG: class I SAM-dependent methyltransferase [Jatrophihabitans sp.]